MVKKYVRIKTIPEFNEWIEKRKLNIEKIHGSPITKIDAMDIISKTDGVKLPEDLLKRLRDNSQRLI